MNHAARCTYLELKQVNSVIFDGFIPDVDVFSHMPVHLYPRKKN